MVGVGQPASVASTAERAVTAPVVDEAAAAISVWRAALGDLFDAPVRAFAGDSAPLAAWDAHSQSSDAPFVWVRVVNRFRCRTFPAMTNDIDPNVLPRVVAIEAGVARCAITDVNPRWDDYQQEFDEHLADSWQLDQSVEIASATLTENGHLVGADPILPYGPDGGVVAVTTTLYVSQIVAA